MFYEKRIRSVPFFRFSELEEISGLVHAFTSRQTDQTCGLESVERQAVDKTPFLDLLGLSSARTIQLRQIHSNHVLRRASPDINHPEGDGLVLTRPGLFGVIKTADCLPILVIDPLRRQLVAVHAGWRGILGGVIESAMDLLSDITGGPFRAVIGPCINACCYAFGVDDLERVVDHLGDGAGGKTRTGHPSLDLPAAVRATLRGVGVVESELDDTCTSCDDDYWSYRATGAKERHAMAAWLEPA